MLKPDSKDLLSDMSSELIAALVELADNVIGAVNNDLCNAPIETKADREKVICLRIKANGAQEALRRMFKDIEQLRNERKQDEPRTRRK